MTIIIKNFYTGEYYTGERKYSFLRKRMYPVFTKSKSRALAYRSVGDAEFDIKLLKRMVSRRTGSYLVYEKETY